MTLAERIRNRKSLLIGGHRGHLSDIRENTIANFEQIQDIDCFHYEIDVQLTKDDQVAVYHDIDLSERSPLQGRIHDYTMAELKAAFEINTLEEIMTWAKAHDQVIAIEIKTNHLLMHEEVSRLAEKLAKLIHDYDFADLSFVFSVDFRALKKIKTLNPEVNLGLIVPIVPVDPVALLQEMDAIIYLTYMSNLSPEIVEKVQAAGLFVDGSVINDESQLKQVLAMNLDLVETDHPEKLVPLLQGLR